MNTRKTLSLAALSLALGCVGAPDAADLEEVAQTQHALTYTVTPVSPLINPSPLQIARATLTGFTPASAVAGTRISLRGTAFERNRYGRLTLNGLGYTISFAGVNGARVAAVNPVMVSSTEITVTVPNGAATGRVRLADALGSFSESPADFVIPLPPPPPAPTRVRVTNNNQYDIVSLIVNGAQVRSCANPLAPGASVDVNVMPGGFAVGAVLGFCTQGAPVSIPPSHLEFNSTVANGVTFTVNTNPFTLGELLTNWGFNSGEWASGLYTDAQGNFRQNTLAFDSLARWTGFDRGARWGNGQALLVSWPNRANCVSFRLGAAYAVTQTCLPFSNFTQDGIPHVRR
jgi:hypothetical protein